MGNGNGNGKKRLLKPGDGMPQAHILRSGAAEKENERRGEVQQALGLAQANHDFIRMAAHIVQERVGPGMFASAPDADRHLEEATQLYVDLTEMQLRLLRTARDRMKMCVPFRDMKDLKFPVGTKQ